MPRTLWIGGKITAPLYVAEPTPHRPDLILWIEMPAGLVLAADVIAGPSPPNAVADCLVQALNHPMQGPPRRPNRIRVADGELADAVRVSVGEPIPIEVGPTPELELLARELGLDLGGGDLPPSYLEDGRVGAELVGQLFEVASRLYPLAPWKSATDSQVVGIDVPELGISGACVSIVGAMDTSFGLVIFESLDAFWVFAEAGAQLSSGAGDEIDLGGRVLSLNFERKSDIPKPMRREMTEHGWRVAGPRAHPRVLLVDRDGVAAPLSARDLRLAIAAAEALIGLLTEQPRLFTTPVAAPIAREYHVDPPGAFTVRITAPHPEDSWLEDDEADSADAVAYDPAETEGSHDEVEAALEQALSMVAGFLDSPHSRTAAGDGPACETFLRYKLHSEGSLDRFTAFDALDFLLDYFPRKVTAEEALIRRMPEVLPRFYDWLGSTGRIPVACADEARASIGAAQAEFFEVAGDSRRFGMARSFMTLMHESGVDPRDEVEVDRFMAGYNLALSAGRRVRFPTSSAAALMQPSEGEPVRAARRWRPAPGQPFPEATAPCPCGSGKKYKRCCMPR